MFDLAGVSSANLDKAIQTVRRCPDTVFVLNHTGRPDIKSGALEPWRRQLRELAAMPNTYCKLSNLARDAGPEWTAKKVEPFFDAAVEAFGFERLMFGTDFPVITLVPRGSIASSLGLMRELMAGVKCGRTSALLRRQRERRLQGDLTAPERDFEANHVELERWQPLPFHRHPGAGRRVRRLRACRGSVPQQAHQAGGAVSARQYGRHRRARSS